jgi:hypothetical protein
MQKEIIHLKLFIRDYIDSLGLFDYLGLGIVALLFLFLFFASFLIKKRLLSATIIGILSFVVLFSGPFVVKILLDKTVRKVDIIDQDIRVLKYIDSMLIKGKLKNVGNVKITSCDINVSIILKANNTFKQIQNSLKPYKTYSFTKILNIVPGQNKEFRIEIKHFNIKKRYKTQLSTVCKGKQRYEKINKK